MRLARRVHGRLYASRSRSASAATERRTKLKTHIVEIFADSNDTYGYRRVHAALTRQGVTAGPELLRALRR
ncbi:IS3 family transposase [Amycolatopsis keratiniphila]|uniref:IS3 family transposase n=1 Tax=Amycolatopsis keratiniphila TaxID=129921 RepID=UPI00096BFB0B|nr:hypothetical protein BS330_27515 [Amycolatopsis keratiniphila subsp. nogabecina]